MYAVIVVLFLLSSESNRVRTPVKNEGDELCPAQNLTAFSFVSNSPYHIMLILLILLIHFHRRISKCARGFLSAAPITVECRKSPGRR